MGKLFRLRKARVLYFILEDEFLQKKKINSIETFIKMKWEF